MTKRPPLRCDAHPQTPAMAIAPGSEPLRADRLSAMEGLPLSSGTPPRCWCWQCWSAAYGRQAGETSILVRVLP